MTKLGRPERYPWEKWFSKKSLTLVRGKHFKISPHGMAQMIRNAAGKERYNVKVSVSIQDDTVRATISPREDS